MARTSAIACSRISARQEQLIAARTAFITSVNHELRTPLTSLSGAIDLLQDRFTEALPAGAKKLISMAARNSDRLLVLVNDILTLQAIDQQRLNIVMEKVDAKRMLCEAVATNSGYGLGNGIRLVAETPEEAEGAAFCADATRLQQVFSNLISNAIKYSPAGGEVTIGARIDAETVTFSVRDTGPGIPKSAQPRIFDRFAKPLHNRQIQVSGTGLGLAITRELVIRQGGSIRFETRSIEDGEKPSGTTFLVSFPRKTDDCTEFQEVA